LVIIGCKGENIFYLLDSKLAFR